MCIFGDVMHDFWCSSNEVVESCGGACRGRELLRRITVNVDTSQIYTNALALGSVNASNPPITPLVWSREPYFSAMQTRNDEEGCLEKRGDEGEGEIGRE